MLRRLLFQNFYLVFRFDGWIRSRFTPAGRIALGHRVQPGLRAETIARSWMTQAHAANAERAESLLQGVFGVDGLMAAMEGAQAQMHGADRQPGVIIARAAHLAR